MGTSAWLSTSCLHPTRSERVSQCAFHVYYFPGNRARDELKSRFLSRFAADVVRAALAEKRHVRTALRDWRLGRWRWLIIAQSTLLSHSYRDEALSRFWLSPCWTTLRACTLLLATHNSCSPKPLSPGPLPLRAALSTRVTGQSHAAIDWMGGPALGWGWTWLERQSFSGLSLVGIHLHAAWPSCSFARTMNSRRFSPAGCPIPRVS